MDSEPMARALAAALHAALNRAWDVGTGEGRPMGSRYYCADSENGEHIDDPSEDALFMLIDDLNDTDNTFVVVQPDEDAPAWFASVAVLDEGGYEIDLRDATRREHEVSTESDIGNIASDLIHWLAARNIPGRPTRQISSS